jgi:hypothetical protein
MNFVCEKLPERRASWANHDHPAPLSPKPWATMTVLVCFLIAGEMMAAAADDIFEAVLIVEREMCIRIPSRYQMFDRIFAA